MSKLRLALPFLGHLPATIPSALGAGSARCCVHPREREILTNGKRHRRDCLPDELLMAIHPCR